MIRILTSLAVVLALTASSAVAVTIETVHVGNPGNANDSTGYGGVAYAYNIGKYEVTNAQYAEFLNAVAKTDTNGLYNASMATSPMGGIARSGTSGSFVYTVRSGYANMPVAFVSWYDSLRFCNWLSNGQPTGAQDASTTEAGVYTFTGPTAVEALPDHSGLSGAKWFLPTQSEWYKAAFHKNDGVTGNYWDYATASDVAPYSDKPDSLDLPANSANYYSLDSDSNNGFNDGFAVTGMPTPMDHNQNYLTNVGAYSQSASPYGTFDQNGNVFEWTEGLHADGESRILLGGGWNAQANNLIASALPKLSPDTESTPYGFRVASVFVDVAEVPEPSTIAMLLVGVAGALIWRRKKGAGGDLAG